MRDRDRRFARLAAIVGRQLGLFTFRQALDVGFPRATIAGLVRSGRWVRVLPRVYRTAETPPAPGEAIIAAWLACGEPAAVSRLAAAAIWELEAPSPETPTVSVPWARQVELPGVEVRRTRRWSSIEMVRRGAIRVTSPMRTLLDLASLLEELPLELALDGAHRQRLVHIDRFETYLDDAVRRRVSGASHLRNLVRLRDPDRPNDSGGETKLLHRLRVARLPLPVPRYWIRTRWGNRRIDLAYPDEKVALEVDSYRWHTGRVRHDDDRARDNELADAGWERRHITSTMLDDPAPTVELTVATALGLRPRGWRPGP